MLIILEHYKLQLTIVLPKVSFIVRKSQKKGKKNLEANQATIQRSIDKIRLGEINEWGHKHNCNTEAEFLTKLNRYVLLDRNIQALNMEINTAIEKARNGNDPELLITLDDNKLNIDTYQQIIHKVYSVIRYRVYQNIQKKVRAERKITRQKSNPNQNDSVVSSNSLALGEQDLTNLVKDLDVEAVHKEVFRLYDLKFGLDTSLALRKLQVLEADDEYLQHYIECLKEAHDRFMSIVFQGVVFNKMQQNPMHSTDLQYGVPWEFNAILDDLLDANPNLLNEEEYKMQMNSMNYSLSQINPTLTPGGVSVDGQAINERLMTEIDEQPAESSAASIPSGSGNNQSSNASRTSQRNAEMNQSNLIDSQEMEFTQGVSISKSLD